jgi:hypothetical protein
MRESLFWAVIAVWAISSWCTHIIICIQDESWGLLIAGAIMFPIGWIHGTGAWFGVW